MPKFIVQYLMLSFVLVIGTSSPVLAQDSIIFIPAALKYNPTSEEACAPKKICAINNTGTAIDNPTFTLTEQPVFSIQNGFQTCPNPLPPDGACIVYVDFCPGRFGEYQGVLTFTGSDQQVLMTGRGVSRGKN
jgi:hypothetical protein